MTHDHHTNPDIGLSRHRVLTIGAYTTWVAVVAPVLWSIFTHDGRPSLVGLVVFAITWIGFGALIGLCQARTARRAPRSRAVAMLIAQSVVGLGLVGSAGFVSTGVVDIATPIAAALLVVIAGSLHTVVSLKQATLWTVVQTIGLSVIFGWLGAAQYAIVFACMFFGFQLLALMLGFTSERERLTRTSLSRALDDLHATQTALRSEINEAADYVRSILPSPLHDTQRGLRVDYAFDASSQLGGDLLGYHFIDEDHLSIYLLDVQGHGVGASLLSVSAHNAIERNLLPHCDMHDPVSVLNALNRAFPARAGGKFFSIVYAVLDTKTGVLRYASAGHPPALVFSPNSRHPVQLESTGTLIGISPVAQFTERTCTIDPGGRLVLFSDGAFEVRLANYNMLSIDGLLHVIKDECRLETDSASLDERRDAMNRHASLPDRVLHRIRALAGDGALLDDFSLVQVRRNTT